MVSDPGHADSNPHQKPPKKRLMLDLKITVGDLLTSLSVILSAAGLIIAWSSDQELQMKQQASQIRDSASVVLSKMERWQEISLYALDSFQESTINISHNFQDRHKSLADIRDIAFDEIARTALLTEKKDFDEQLESAYVSLYGHDPTLKALVELSISKMRDDQTQMFSDLEEEAQDVIRGADRRAAFAEPATVGDQMRQNIEEIRVRYKYTLAKELAVTRDKLANIVKSSDRDLVLAKR